ncbi:MAG: TNT domain-containing protein [Oscillospiraceae bacterium]|nr:TNT domain-containing protein [Oscillospiraceae bacterium]
MRQRRNDAGEALGSMPVRLKSPDYGTGEYRSGIFPEVKWEEYRQEYADSDGFDLRNMEENGNYCMEVELPKGTVLIRYGSEMGRFTAPKHTPYDALGLPYVRETVEYHEYEVVADSIKVFCRVKRGRVAPMFDSDGGGIQYLHPQTILELTRRKHVLKELIP